MAKRAPFKGPFGLVPALDVDSVPAMLRLVAKTTKVEGVAGYKLGLTGVLPIGLPAAVRALRDITDKPIVYDHQKAGPDMPDMAQKFAKLCKKAGADALILFPVAGPVAVKSFVGETIGNRMIPIVGGHIPVPDYVKSGGGFMIDNVLERIFAHAVETGARHFVIPANDPKAIRRHTEWMAKTVADPVAFLTGFGTLGGDIASAFKAARACPLKFAIVGRAVSLARSPGDAAKRFVDEMAKSV